MLFSNFRLHSISLTLRFLLILDRECTRMTFLDWPSRTLCWMELRLVLIFLGVMLWNKSMVFKPSGGSGQIFGFCLEWYLLIASFSLCALNWKRIWGQWYAHFSRSTAPTSVLPEGHLSCRMWLGRLPPHHPQHHHHWAIAHHCRGASGSSNTVCNNRLLQQQASINHQVLKKRFVKVNFYLPPQICTPCYLKLSRFVFP